MPAKKKKNAAKKSKLRKINRSTGWIPATAVRFVKKKGKPVTVLVRRAKGRKKKR